MGVEFSYSVFNVNISDRCYNSALGIGLEIVSPSVTYSSENF